MPKQTHKSAAVPFVNQKGERSMKRVKVERYVAGKKPAYAKDDDEDEYYTTDDEQISGESDYMDHDTQPGTSASGARDDNRKTSFHHSSDSEESEDDNKPDVSQRPVSESDEASDDDDDDDDPRFRALKRIEATIGTKKLLHDQISVLSATVASKYEDKTTIVDEAEEEDEEDIRTRHNLARQRKIEEPIGPQIALDEFTDQQLSLKQEEFERSRAKKIETDDILKDLKLTGIKPKEDKKREKQRNEQKLKEMLDKAKEQAAFQSQLHKRVEEDVKRETERDLLGKTNISARELESVNTDDEDDEIAYEEWKLREIQRVLRDRSERQLELARAR